MMSAATRSSMLWLNWVAVSASATSTRSASGTTRAMMLSATLVTGITPASRPASSTTPITRVADWRATNRTTSRRSAPRGTRSGPISRRVWHSATLVWRANRGRLVIWGPRLPDVDALEDPKAGRDADERRAAVRDERERDAGDRHDPDHHPDVDEQPEHEHRAQAGCEHRPERAP